MLSQVVSVFVLGFLITPSVPFPKLLSQGSVKPVSKRAQKIRACVAGNTLLSARDNMPMQMNHNVTISTYTYHKIICIVQMNITVVGELTCRN